MKHKPINISRSIRICSTRTRHTNGYGMLWLLRSHHQLWNSVSIRTYNICNCWLINSFSGLFVVINGNTYKVTYILRVVPYSLDCKNNFKFALNVLFCS